MPICNFQVMTIRELLINIQNKLKSLASMRNAEFQYQ